MSCFVKYVLKQKKNGSPYIKSSILKKIFARNCMSIWWALLHLFNGTDISILWPSQTIIWDIGR